MIHIKPYPINKEREENKMASIRIIDSNKNYRYVIEDNRGGIVCCTKDDLVSLHKRIGEIIEQPEPKPRIQQHGSIGGMMVRKMIESIEKRY